MWVQNDMIMWPQQTRAPTPALKMLPAVAGAVAAVAGAVVAVAAASVAAAWPAALSGSQVLGVAHRMFKHMFEGLEERWPRELAAVRAQYDSSPVVFTDEPCVVHWEEGIAMLRAAGITEAELGDFDDLSGAQVRIDPLGSSPRPGAPPSARARASPTAAPLSLSQHACGVRATRTRARIFLGLSTGHPSPRCPAHFRGRPHGWPLRQRAASVDVVVDVVAVARPTMFLAPCSQELLLGELVKEKHGADFFIMDRYPSAIRPFYTMPCQDDERYSNSYDMFIRGQEICSGAQRVHDAALLRSRIAGKGVDVVEGAQPPFSLTQAGQRGRQADARRGTFREPREACPARPSYFF